MNIMLFPRVLAKTGVGNYVAQLARELNRKGHKVIIVSGLNELSFNDSNIKYIHIPVNKHSKNPIHYLNNIKAICRCIRDNKIDIVHCHHRMAALYMKICSILVGVPFVYTLHSVNIPCDFRHRIVTFVGKAAIAVSTDAYEFLTKKLKVPYKKACKVYSGVDESKLLPLSDNEQKNLKALWNIDEEKIIVAIHSRIAAIKNHILVAEALNKLPPQQREKIVVVCSGDTNSLYYKKLVAKIAEYNLQHNFRFVGWCDSRDILGIADIMIAPSFKEGFPLNVVEAFLMKVPVARSKTGGYEDQKFCFPISERNCGDVVKILEDFCNGEAEKYRANTEIAYKYAKENFTLEKMTVSTVEIYKKVCEKSGN